MAGRLKCRKRRETNQRASPIGWLQWVWAKDSALAFGDRWDHVLSGEWPLLNSQSCGLTSRFLALVKLTRVKPDAEGWSKQFNLCMLQTSLRGKQASILKHYRRFTSQEWKKCHFLITNWFLYCAFLLLVERNHLSPFMVPQSTEP